MILSDVIIPSGEKIKQIRKLLGMRQEELTNGKITRNLISYIENGKTRLMPDTAEIIAESINDKAKRMGKGQIVAADYLLEDEVAQAQRILRDIANKLRGSMDNERIFLEEIKKAEAIIENWNITEGIGEIYQLTGEFYYYKDRCIYSYFYNLKALENYIRENNRETAALVALELAKCSIKLENYQEAIIYNSYGLSTIKGKEDIYPDIYKRATFNNALAYKKLEKPDEALVELEKLELIITNLNEPEIGDVYLLKGNCYLIKGEYQLALGVYNKLLNSEFAVEDSPILPLVYNNIATVHYEMHQYEMALQHFFKCYELSELNKELERADILYKIGKIFFKTGKYDLAEKHLMMVLKDDRRYRDMILLLNAYKLMLNIYYKMNKDISIRSMLEEIMSFNNYRNDKEMYQIERLLKEAAYYYLEKDINFSKNLLKLGLDFQGEII